VAQRRRWSFPSLAAPSRSVGLVGGVCVGVEPGVECPRPHLLLLALCDGGTNLVGLDAPDQGVDQGPSRPLGLTRRRST
jgi:hypothetical protein